MKKKLVIMNSALSLVLILLICLGVILHRGSWNGRETNIGEEQTGLEEKEQVNSETSGKGTTDHSTKGTKGDLDIPESTEEGPAPTAETKMEGQVETDKPDEETEGTNAPEGNKETDRPTKETEVEETDPSEVPEETTSETEGISFVPGENELEPGGGL